MAKKKSVVNEGYNFVFDDDYINDAKEYFSSAAGDIDRRLTSYLEIMEQICEDEKLEGETAAALAALMEQAERLKDAVSTYGERAQKALSAFLKEIDSIDKSLY